MTEPTEKDLMNRRGFLKVSGIGAVAGAAVVAASDDGRADAAPAAGRASAGYRETEHVKTVYRLARF